MVQCVDMGYPTHDNRGGNKGGGRDFGGRSFGGSRPTRPAEMHQAVCSNCGKDCEVPFRPTGDKPVYCRECFAKNRSHDGDRNFGNNRDNREAPRGDFKRFDDRPTPTPRNNELDVINSKLDLILKMLKSNSGETTQPKKESKPEAVQEISEAPVEVIKKKRASKKTEEVVELPSDNPTE